VFFLDSGAIIFSNYSNKNSILKQIENLQLSPRTIQRRIICLSANIQSQSELILKNCISFSLALDESTDVGDISQLCVYYRCLTNEYKLITEILCLKSLHGHTRGQDILFSFNEVITKFNLNMEKMFCNCY
jgi:hypothetical protein